MSKTAHQTSAAETMRETLARLCDLLAAHPDLPAPYVTIYDHLPETAELKWYLHISGKGGPEVQKATAQKIIRTIGGKWDKSLDRSDNSMDFRQTRDGLDFRVVVTREAVCERVVVGTEAVTIPASEAQPAMPERTEEREVVEWRCEPLLAEQVSA